MAYTITDPFGNPRSIRIITVNNQGVPELKDAFAPQWWVCDPCNPPNKRYEVTYREGQQPQYLSWYEVVTTDDTEKDIAAKLDFYKRVIVARNAMDAASLEYRRLTGCGWSVCPTH